MVEVVTEVVTVEDMAAATEVVAAEGDRLATHAEAMDICRETALKARNVTTVCLIIFLILDQTPANMQQAAKSVIFRATVPPNHHLSVSATK